MLKRSLLILILSFCFFIFTGCDVASLFGTVVTNLSDERFNGDFTYFYFWMDTDGIDEITEYTSLDFDGTNKVWYYSKYSSYHSGSGWSYSGDYLGDYYSWDCEFEVNNGQYRWRLWDNEYSDWRGWEAYSFSNDGNILTLKNWFNIAENDLVLEKD